MAGFDRSKIKKTTAQALQKQQAEHETKRPPAGGERTILEIKPGDNKFRLFPFHPDSGIETYAVPKTVSWLTVTKPKRDDKGRKIEGQFEEKRTTVFNSKVHGNLPKDLVEEYLNIAKKVAIPNYTDVKADQDKLWNFMTYAGKGSNAIKPSDVWVCYAQKELSKDDKGNSVWSKIGELELKRTVCDQLTEKAIEFSGDAMTPDIYTDPDEGICVIINKSGADKDTTYKVTLDTQKYKQGNAMISAAVPTPLSDEQLEAWFKLPSLAKKFKNSFKRKDLDMQIEGLQNFEKFLKTKGYDFSVFVYEDFLNTIEELIALVPETPEGESSDENEGEGENTENGGGEAPVMEEEVTQSQTPTPPKQAPRPTLAPKAKVEQTVTPAKTPAAGPPKVTPPKATVAPKAPVQTPAKVETTAQTPPKTDSAGEDRLAKIRGMMNKNNRPQ